MHQPMQPEDQPQLRSQGTRKSSCLHLELPSSQEDGPVRWSGHDCQPLCRSWMFGQKHFAKQKLPGGLQQARLQCVQAWLQANQGQRQLDQEISKKTCGMHHHRTAVHPDQSLLAIFHHLTAHLSCSFLIISWYEALAPKIKFDQGPSPLPKRQSSAGSRHGMTPARESAMEKMDKGDGNDKDVRSDMTVWFIWS